MSVRGFGGFALLLFALAGLFATGAGEFLMAAAVLAALLFLSLLIARFVRPRCALSAPRMEIERLETAHAELSLHNPFPMPIFNVEADVVVRAGKAQAPSPSVHEFTLDIAARKRETRSIVIAAAHRGVYSVEVDYLRSSDIFRLFSIPGSSPPALEILSLPKLHTELSQEAVSALRLADDGLLWKKSAAGDIQPDTRLYQMGDALHSIHWKQSVSRQKLFTRLREEPRTPSCAVLIHTQPLEGADEEAELAYEDALCECALGLLYQQVSAHSRVTLLPCDITIDAPEILSAAACKLATLPYEGSMDEPMLRLLLESTPDVLVYVSGMESEIAQSPLMAQLAAKGCRLLCFCPEKYHRPAYSGFIPV